MHIQVMATAPSRSRGGFVVVLALLAALFAAPANPRARAQGIGDFLNFEAPVHHALAVVDVGGEPFLLVCNTPDDSVEVYTAERTPRFVQRVPVGQRPVSIAVRPSDQDGQGTRRCYTANWLGDSLTAFDLTPAAPGAPVVRVHRSRAVGDEPIALAILPVTTEPWTQPGGGLHEALVVSFATAGAWGVFDPDTLRPAVSPLGTPLAHRELYDPTTAYALKEPRGVAFDPSAPNARLVLANHRGGNSPAYDFDLWISDDLGQSLEDEAATQPVFGGLGTTNTDLVFADDGTLFVSGILARNNDFPAGVDPLTAAGEPIFRDMVVNETGFATSFLAVVRDLGGTPTVDQVIDLNLDAATGEQAATPVTHPTAVVLHDTKNPNSARLFVNGFSSDSLAVLERSSGQWRVQHRLDLSTADPFTDTNLGGGMRGPRSMVLRADATDELLFVYHRLEHSVSVLDAAYTDPDQALLGTFPLQRDPTPAKVRDGRKYLYSSRLSGGGNVSCSTCHVDGQSDFLAWNLADGVAVPPEGQGLPGALGPNPGLKGPIVTQTLRGLVNFEIPQDFAQVYLFSNRPYHWRGDRGVFEDFNGAFVNLMGIANPDAPGRGIPDVAMKQFRDFVFTIHYPPNPDQPRDRRYSGTVYADPANPDPADLNDPRVGQGAQRGLKLAHIRSQDGTSCVQCHSLPEGSNNRLTEAMAFPTLPDQSLETTQLKGLATKQKRLMRYDGNGGIQVLPPGSSFGAITGEFGMTRIGVALPGRPLSLDATLSVRDFIQNTFAPPVQDTRDLAAFVREFDTGVGPLVGFTDSIDFAEYNADPDAAANLLDLLEGQCDEANCALVVHLRTASGLHGLFYEVQDAARPYHEMRQPGLPPLGALSRADLLAFLDQSAPNADPDAVLNLHAVPLGSERRIATLGPHPAMRLTRSPSDVVLLPMRPAIPNLLNPAFTRLYTQVVINEAMAGPDSDGLDVDPEITRYMFQVSLQLHAASATPPAFGWDTIRHGTPRQVRLSGQDIAPGARVRLFAPNAADIASSPAGQPPTTTASSATNFIVLEAPLYPTRDAGGALVWQTAVEVDSFVLLGLMNGGPMNPGVAAAWTSPWSPAVAPLVPDPATFDPSADVFQPLAWNWYYVRVLNDPSDSRTFGEGGWQRLTVE